MNSHRPAEHHGRLYVIGAGMAGLAAAVEATRRGRAVTLIEATAHGGGRCRSFHDATLDRVIDNGTHLILGANRNVFAFLGHIGAPDGLVPLGGGDFPFFDLASRQAWCLSPKGGPLPWWLLNPKRRVPDSGLGDYLALWRLASAGPEARLGDCLDRQRPIFKRLWNPLSLAVLNCPAESASAVLFWRVLAATFFKGAEACRPHWAPGGLSSALVDPALSFLRRAAVEILFSQRLRALPGDGDRICRLDFGQRSVELQAGEDIVLALPPGPASVVLGDGVPEFATRAIVNVHFRLAEGVVLPGGSGFLGLIGGAAHWMFQRGDMLSVTISAADYLAARPAAVIAAEIWTEAARALSLADGPPPPYRVIKERRATIAQTPAQVARRPGARTRWRNLFLAGDWTDTGLPATIEGAVASGFQAARLAAGQN